MRVRRAGSPGVDEETHGHERRGDDAGKEMVFDLAKSTGEDCREDAVLEVEELDGEGEQSGREHGEEDEGGGGSAEAKVPGVNDRKGLFCFVSAVL